MIVTTDSIGVTVQNNTTSLDRVRIGVTLVTFYVNGKQRRQREGKKPHDSYNVGDLQRLLRELNMLVELMTD